MPPASPSPFLSRRGKRRLSVPIAPTRPAVPACKSRVPFARFSMNYPDSVRFLYSLGNEVKTAKLGLDRIRTLLDALGSPHRVGRFVHVAGTNGKGSTSALIESALRSAGLRTGLFTSPHLIEPTERIRIGGAPVSSTRFAAAFRQVHEMAERLLEEERIDLHPTYFETVTAMAFCLFRDSEVETAVMEVGLGGRLDATNVVLPALSVVTPVDFDHEALLGRSIEAIAGEKAGILKPGIPAVFAAQRPEAKRTLEEAAVAVGAPFESTTVWPVENLEVHEAGSRFDTRGIHIECNLAGEHQAQNALTAVVALSALDVPVRAIEAGIRSARWPGRLERVASSPDVYLDGAHNPAGARSLAAYISRFHSRRRVWLIYGAMRDKAVEEISGILFPLASELILTAPAQARAAHPEAMAAMVDHPRMRIAPGVEAALAIARNEAAPGDVVFVTGSLFLVGEARALLVK